MAESLEQHVKNLETAEKNLLNRTFQQTVVAALGQFALTNSDLDALLNQTVMLVAQTLGVEYSAVFEQLPAGPGCRPVLAGNRSTTGAGHGVRQGADLSSALNLGFSIRS